MAHVSKKQKENLKEFERTNLYPPDEAITILKKTAKARFDETVEIHIRLGIDPKRSDQNVRGTVVLPHGTGKTPRVIAFVKADKVKDVTAAGADEAGAEELIEKVKGGLSDFDLVVASPDMMGALGKTLGRVLGPRMPSPKSGTVGPDVAKLVEELKSGKVQYRADKQGIVHTAMGKVSFTENALRENLSVLADAVIRARPAAAKGVYLRSVVLCTSMGPGIRLDPQKVTLLATESRQ